MSCILGIFEKTARFFSQFRWERSKRVLGYSLFWGQWPQPATHRVQLTASQ